MRICTIGSGYVGLVSAACFAEMGNKVTCVDINPEVVRKLNAGEIHIYEPGLEDLVIRNHQEGRLSFTTRLEDGMDRADFIFICVGTPSGEDGSCDLSYVAEAARAIGRNLKKFAIVVDKSTVPVGTADMVHGLIAEELAKRGVGIDFEVVSNPEFLKEGDAVNDFMKPDRVIVGTSSLRAAEMMHELYAPFARSREKLLVLSVRSAEMAKYAANCMLATKISFINEMARICEEVGADIREVRMGIGSDHRIGYHFIYPGVGYGGSCFPKDVKALIHTAQEAGVRPKLLEAVEEVNKEQKVLMAGKVLDYFAAQGGVKGKTLALWGLAFKANTDDMREAASLNIIKALTEQGMRIRAFDPVAGPNAAQILADNKLVDVVADQTAALKGADALMVVTEWNQFRNPDFGEIKAALRAPILFDGRNLYSPAQVAEAGFAYFCIGQGGKGAL